MSENGNQSLRSRVIQETDVGAVGDLVGCLGSEGLGPIPSVRNLGPEFIEVVSEEEAAFADWLDPDELLFIEPLDEETLDRYDEIWTSVVAG